jgi:hypothetical protein
MVSIVASTHAAVLLGDERAPEPLGARLRAELCQDFLIGAGLELRLGGDALVLHPLADALADCFRFSGDFEIDGHASGLSSGL